VSAAASAISIHIDSVGMSAATVDELFARFGSSSVAVTVAVLVSVAGVPEVTTIVIVSLAATAIVPIVQVTVVVPTQVPALVIAEENDEPAGRTSFIATTRSTA